MTGGGNSFPDEIQEYSLSQFLIRQLVEFAGSRNFARNSMKVLDYGWKKISVPCDVQHEFISKEQHEGP